MDKRIHKLTFDAINVKDFQEKLSPQKEFVLYGKRNDFPDVLIKMLYNSALHYNICQKRKDMILGDGITIEKSSNKNKIITEKFIQNCNRYGESFENILEKVAFDHVVFGMSAVQVIWGRGGNQIVEMYHIPMDKLRFGKKDKIGNIDKIFYSECWDKYMREEYTPIPLTPFTTIPEIIEVEPTQIMLIKPYCPGLSYYTNPDYIGGLNYINLDWQMSEFANSYVKNGFFPNVMISCKNISEEDKEFVVNNFSDQYNGPSNTNKVLFNFTEGENDIKVEPISFTGMENLITTLNDLTEKNILEAHGISGILVGIAEAGSLSDASQINNAYLAYEASKTKPDQNLILSYFNKILKINGMDTITISSSSPIPFQGSEDMMSNCLTVNELRKELGFEQLDPSNYKDIVNVVISGSAPKAPVVSEPVKTQKITKR